MALGADQVLVDRGSQVIFPESAMGIVAVAARDRAFVYRVVERHSERPLHVAVALVAKHRLRSFEQDPFHLEAVDAMATGAAYASLGMWRALEVGVITDMASQAPRINFFRRCLCELKYLGYVPARVHVRFAGSMAAFAGHALAPVFKCQLGMRIAGEVLHLVLMAGGAGLGADIVRGGSRNRSRALGRIDCLLVLSGSIYSPGFPKAGEDRNQRDTQQRASHPSAPMRGFLRLLVLKMCLCP